LPPLLPRESESSTHSIKRRPLELRALAMNLEWRKGLVGVHSANSITSTRRGSSQRHLLKSSPVRPSAHLPFPLSGRFWNGQLAHSSPRNYFRSGMRK
jgi:hypothetical protein